MLSDPSGSSRATSRKPAAASTETSSKSPAVRKLRPPPAITALPSSTPRRLSLKHVDRLSDALVIEFSDGETALFPARVLYQLMLDASLALSRKAVQLDPE